MCGDVCNALLSRSNNAYQELKVYINNPMGEWEPAWCGRSLQVTYSRCSCFSSKYQCCCCFSQSLRVCPHKHLHLLLKIIMIWCCVNWWPWIIPWHKVRHVPQKSSKSNQTKGLSPKTHSRWALQKKKKEKKGGGGSFLINLWKGHISQHNYVAFSKHAVQKNLSILYYTASEHIHSCLFIILPVVLNLSI